MAQKKNSSPKRGTTNSRTSGKKKGSAGKRFGVALLVVLLIVVLAAGGIGAAYGFTDGFGTKTLNVFVVKCGEQTYTKNAGDLVVQPGTEFTVEQLAGETDYTVAIRAKGTQENDFEFQLGDESGYHWKDQDGKDYAEGFTLTRTETGFKLDFGTLAEIITAVKGTPATLTSKSSGGDLFTLVVTCGKNEIALGFKTEIAVTGVELNPPALVFPDAEGNRPSEGEGQESNESNSEAQDSIIGVYKFYSRTIGNDTYAVGDTVSGGLLAFTYTEDFMQIEIREDGILIIRTNAMGVTENTFVWEAAANDPNTIIVSNADGSGRDEITKDGDFLLLTTSEGKFMLKKQTSEQSNAAQGNAAAVEQIGGKEDE